MDNAVEQRLLLLVALRDAVEKVNMQRVLLEKKAWDLCSAGLADLEKYRTDALAAFKQRYDQGLTRARASQDDAQQYNTLVSALLVERDDAAEKLGEEVSAVRSTLWATYDAVERGLR